jgi:hypothetical protein
LHSSVMQLVKTNWRPSSTCLMSSGPGTSTQYVSPEICAPVNYGRFSKTAHEDP